VTVTLQLTLADAAATEALGRALAAAFPGADRGAVVACLHGELGAGKTSCVRSLLQGLGVQGTVRSPTYTLVETYLLPGLTAIHADLYRLRAAAEFTELGISEFLVPGHLILLEWSENGGAYVPPPDLELTLHYAGTGRSAALQARTAIGEAWLAKLGDDSRLIPYLSNLT
jgi:tRNA threonylcarbamoyladenosine biosynthesis protein TsaE